MLTRTTKARARSLVLAAIVGELGGV
jgi:hypothetical protein